MICFLLLYRLRPPTQDISKEGKEPRMEDDFNHKPPKVLQKLLFTDCLALYSIHVVNFTGASLYDKGLYSKFLEKF